MKRSDLVNLSVSDLFIAGANLQDRYQLQTRFRARLCVYLIITEPSCQALLCVFDGLGSFCA